MVNTATRRTPHTRTVVTGYLAASAGRQCAATLIDLALLAAASGMTAMAARNAALGVLVALELVIVYAVGEGTRGVTPGRMLLGIRTVRAEGQRDPRAGILPAGAGRTIIKYLILTGSALLFLIGLIAMMLSPLFSRGALHQGWADRAARLVEVDVTKRVTAAEAVDEGRNGVRFEELHRNGAMRQVDDSSMGSADSLDVRITPDMADMMPSSAPAAPVPMAPAPSMAANTAAPAAPASIGASKPTRPIPVPQETGASVPRPGTPRRDLPVPAPSVPVSGASSTPRTTRPGLPASAARPAGSPSPVPAPAPVPAPLAGHAASASTPAPAAPAVPPALPKSGSRITIYFEDGSRQPLVTPSNVVLGRKPSPQQPGDVTLAVPDRTGTVSRSHARLEITAGHLWITDLGSTNGTRVTDEDGNETKLEAHSRHAIQSGARISLGDMGCSIITAKNRGRRS